MAGRLQDIFENAVGLQGPAREEYLTSASGTDEALRAEVVALLRVHDQAPKFLASPTAGAAAPATIIATPSEHEGQMIGRYKLLQPIGEGGFGSVWMAEQREPVKRRVALKIIKLGMDTRQVIARFEAERQALAMMDHPNIAKVLDAGSTEAGRPYFVMEYIKGVPVLEYCDTERLDTRARLDLFMSVCHAIQHAHQKGIIHRDIKPSNVLITMHDGVPVPKVIDFGIAKATNTELTQKTLFTEHRQMIGTPAYMSPEQAEMSGLDIDTRSDVYSLGVLLYELLTGTTPFATEELLSKGFAEMMRIIREVEPHKPSTRLSTLGATATKTAQQRRSDTRRLGLVLRGDLDWIVMKCLEKDRTRRYETANGLAADIQRHLSDEPVTAGAPTAGYRLRKFVKRNRGTVIAGTLVAAALVLGIAGTAWQAKVASDSRDAEKARADELKKVSDFQEKMLSQVDPTMAGVRLTEDVNRRFAAALEKAKVPEAEQAGLAAEFRRGWARVNATDAAAALIDETILKPAVKAIDEQFKDQPVVDAQLRLALADRYYRLGLYDAAFTLQDSALKTQRRELRDDHPSTLQTIDNMGAMLREWGKFAEAEPYTRESLERCRRVLGEEAEGTIASTGNMGNLLQAQGKYAEAEPYLREALEKSRRVLGEKHGFTVASLNGLGNLLQAQGKYAEAERHFREALEKTHDSTSLNNVGFVLTKQGKLAEAEPYYREALEMARRDLGEENPGTITFINNLGGLLELQGKNVEAEPYFREALEKRRRVLAEEHPDVLQSIYNLGYVLQKQGKRAEAEPFFLEFVEKRRRLKGEEHPDTLLAIITLTVLLQDQGKLAEAEPLFRELVEKSPRVFGEQDQQTLMSFNSLGSVLLLQGKLAEAEMVEAEGVRACQRAFTGPHPTTALLLHHHAEVLRALGRLEEALTEANRAHEMYREHLEWGPGEAVHAATVLATILSAQGKLDEAIAVQREVLEIHRATLPPGNGPVLSSSLAMFGLALLQRHTLEAAREAEPVLRECLEIRLQAMPGDWRVPNTRSLLGGAILASAELDAAPTPAARAERLREAEPLLLDGYAGLKDHPGVPSPALAGGDRRREALERVARLYEAWDKAEPGKGYDAKAAEWKAKLEPTSLPSAEGHG